jgi:hypothetical protein
MRALEVRLGPVVEQFADHVVGWSPLCAISWQVEQEQTHRVVLSSKGRDSLPEPWPCDACHDCTTMICERLLLCQCRVQRQCVAVCTAISCTFAFTVAKTEKMVRPATRPRFMLMRSLHRPLLYLMTCNHSYFPRGCTPSWPGFGAGQAAAAAAAAPEVPVGPLSLFAESFAGNAPFCVNCGTLLDLPDTNNIVCDGCGCKYNYMGACAASPACLWDPCGRCAPSGARSTNSSSGLCSSSTCPTPPLPTALHTGVG